MKISSPLRYPGGKSAMAGLLGQIRRMNGLGDRVIAEPFAGGAGASLTLLYLEETPEIYINDLDRAVYSFWWTVVNQPDLFMEMLSRKRVSMSEWRRQRDVYRNQRQSSRLLLGYAAFYLNRCNRSGIIMNGGPIGGVKQSGIWKLNARFNKPDLLRRCEKIAEFRDRIHVSNGDGIDFIKELNFDTTFFFIDPPYFVKGNSLYLNSLSEKYHATLAPLLKSMKNAAWVLTYDDCPQIRRLYAGWATIRPFSLQYSAAERRSGKELLILPKWMCLPVSQASSALKW